LTSPNPINFVIVDEDCNDIGHASVLMATAICHSWGKNWHLMSWELWTPWRLIGEWSHCSTHC